MGIIWTKEKVESEFWKRVNIKGEDDCWEWTGKLHKKGYGELVVAKKIIRAHRFAYTLVKGEIPEGLLIRHTCDNRKCCNPNHLLTGTQLDNARDRDSRHRRNVKGIRHPQAKFTLEMLQQVRARLETGEAQTAIARDYGVYQGTISKIKRGATYATNV